MVSEDLKIGVATAHVPLDQVKKHINKELIISKLDQIKSSLIRDFGKQKPKIAVLGLNPHAGDGGVIGKEDDEIIKPTLKKIFDKGTLVFGPFAADGFFGNNQYEKYDAVIATYHDQGLIPFKTLSFGKGVNYTAGLSKIRTSPDHGTAYEIAGKNKADFNSFKEAVYLALDIYSSRIRYKEISVSPMKIREKQEEKNNR